MFLFYVCILQLPVLETASSAMSSTATSPHYVVPLISSPGYVSLPYTYLFNIAWICLTVILLVGFYCNGFRLCCKCLNICHCGEILYNKLFGTRGCVQVSPDTSTVSLECGGLNDPPPDYDAALYMRKPDCSRIVNISTVSQVCNITHVQPAENCDIEQKSPCSEDKKSCLKTLSSIDTPLNLHQSQTIDIDMPQHTLHSRDSGDALPSYSQAVLMLERSNSFEETV